MNNEVREKILEMFSEDVAGMDEKTALINKTEFTQRGMKELANIAKQPATLEIHNEGDVKTMSDGTQYRVTPTGWVKILDDKGDV